MTFKFLTRTIILVKLVLVGLTVFAQEQQCTYGKDSLCSHDSYCIKYEQNKDVCITKFQKELKVIQYPFEISSYCDQGPLSPLGNSHTWNNTAYAVDLKSTSNLNVNVITGVDGTVIAYDGCKTENDQCGLGFGNQVKILTDDNFIVLYAHLKTVKVKTGDLIKAGKIIGTEGTTGWAGDKNKHLHLSVHYDWKSVGMDYWKQVGYIPRSVPFIVQDCNERSYSVEDLKCKRVSKTPTMFCNR